ncbi:MAG: O-antigen ligase family protein [Deltaproteobacteria bacterium]|nr:O-antigen ligase family protein [Deltaproteobacteria bacterium]
MRRSEALSAGLGAVALACAVLVIGAALRWTQALVAIVMIGAIAPLVLSRRTFAHLSPLVVALAVPLVLTIVQLLPLPGLAHALNPVGAGLRDDGAALAQSDPWRAITLDAPGSLRAVAFFTILLAVAVLALRMSTSERGRYRILATVAAVCGITALVVGVHEVLGATSLYGVYDPVQATPPVLGPLLNGNHLGCLMAAGCVLSIALVVYRNQRGWVRALWAFGGLACAVCAFATLSRGAALALAIGGLTTIVVLVMQRFGVAERRRRSRFVTSSLPIGIVAACALVVVLYSSAGRVGSQISNTSLSELQDSKSKYAAWRSSVQLVEESPWLGVGRGGFEPTFTRVHPSSAFQTASHLENEYVQAVVDWGVIGGLLLGLAGIWFAITAIKRWRTGPLAAGALGALSVIAIQSVVDFGVELLGVAVPGVAIAATLSYGPLQEVSGFALVRARALCVLHIGGLAVGALLLLGESTVSVAEDHDRIMSIDAVKLDDLKGPFERHPLDYFNYGVAASVMMAEDNRDGAIRMLNHALTLHPTHSGLHRMTARILRGYGYETQAAIEYAAAMRGTSRPQALLREVVQAFRDKPSMAAAAIPQEQNIDVVVRALGQLERTDVATVWLSGILQARPRDARACEVLYAISLEKGDLDAAEAAARHCVKIVASKQSRLALARVLFRNNVFAEVIRLLHDVSTWNGRIVETSSAWMLVCDAHAGLMHWDDAERCLHRIDASGLIPAIRRGEITSRLDKIEALRRGEDILLDATGWFTGQRRE